MNHEAGRPRKVEDIRFEYPREALKKVHKVSELNEYLYGTFVSPWVRAAANPVSAAWLKWLHPMRGRRYLFSEKLNPWMAPIAAVAPLVRAQREPVEEGNPLLAQEKAFSAAVSGTLDAWRKARDQAAEAIFTAIYGG